MDLAQGAGCCLEIIDHVWGGEALRQGRTGDVLHEHHMEFGDVAQRFGYPDAVRGVPAEAIPVKPKHDCEHVRPIRPVAVCLPDETPLMDVASLETRGPQPVSKDRKSTRLNSSHITISYAVFC